MGFLPDQKKYTDKDPKRIFLYMFDHDIDKADNTFKTSKCEICRLPISRFNMRVCVICKRATDKLCAGKYWIPGEKIGKEKDTLESVCLICRDQLLLFKQEKTGISANLRPYRNFLKGEDGHISFLPPLLWAPKRIRGACYECGRAYKNALSVHNCRVCGEIVDNRCTLKMKLPKGFERKLEKENQKNRVCLDCRYYIISGIQLIEAEPKPFSSFEIEKEWENRIDVDNLTIKKNTLFPAELSVTLKNDRKFPEMPEYRINALTNSFKSPDINIDRNITNFVVNGEENQKMVVVLRIEMDYKLNQNKSTKKLNENVSTSSASSFGDMNVVDNTEDDNSVFSELLNVLNRKSTRRKLKKVETKLGTDSKHEENELERAIRKRFEALGDEYMQDDESADDSWLQKK